MELRWEEAAVRIQWGQSAVSDLAFLFILCKRGGSHSLFSGNTKLGHVNKLNGVRRTKQRFLYNKHMNQHIN